MMADITKIVELKMDLFTYIWSYTVYSSHCDPRAFLWACDFSQRTLNETGDLLF